EEGDDPPGGAHRLPGDSSVVDPYLVPCRSDRVPLPALEKGRLAVDHHSTGAEPAGEGQGWELFEVADPRSWRASWPCGEPARRQIAGKHGRVWSWGCWRPCSTLSAA